MRTDPELFASLNEAPQRRPRFIVEIDFVASGILRLTSHDDIPSVPGSPIEGVIRSIDSVTQQIQPDEARATIGSLSFSAVDLAGAITADLRSRFIDDDSGLRDKRVRFLCGFEGLDYTDFVLFQTQRVSDCRFANGVYEVSCSDIQRELRAEVFTQMETRLAASINTTANSLTVDDTTDFARVQHGPSYGDAPSAKVGYLELSTGEIVRYTAKNATHFTGVTRALFGTQAQAITVDGADPPDSRPVVREFIYLELPAIKIAWALLTGELYGSADTLPDGWHLGIDPADLVEDDFTGIGSDLWDPDDDEAGFIARFTHLSATDGKRFLEREVYLLAGVYSPVNAEGQLGLHRMTAVIAEAPYVAALDDSCIIAVDQLRHDMPSLHNQFLISWNFDGEAFTRKDLFIDAVSTNIHGTSPLLELEFRGLSADRHTTQIIQGVVDRMRDRYANPPIRISVTVLGSRNKLEVGDIVRLEGASLRDFTAHSGDSIDRSFEIQRAAYDWVTGRVVFDLLGSAGAGAPTPSPFDPILDDAKYCEISTDLDTVLDIVAGVVQPGTYDLTGDADMNSAGARYCYDDDLEIGVGATITINDNVQLRIKGFLQVEGTIDGVGRGKAGGGASALGTPGFVGNTHGAWGVLYERDPIAFVSTYYGNAKLTQGQNDAFPPITIALNDDDDVGNIPTDMRGTSGGRGGDIASQDDVPLGAITPLVSGGDGVASGAALCIVCRGMDFGADGLIDLSGADSDPTSIYNTGIPLDTFPGPGASGGPGCLLIILDGGGSVAPDLFGHVVGRTGAVQEMGEQLSATQHQGVGALVGAEAIISGHRDTQVLGGIDMSGAISRITYLQDNPDAVSESAIAGYRGFRPYPYPDDYVLTADSAQPLGMDWKPPAGGAGNLDGGTPSSVYGGTSGIDGGAP